MNKADYISITMTVAQLTSRPASISYWSTASEAVAGGLISLRLELGLQSVVWLAAALAVRSINKQLGYFLPSAATLTTPPPQPLCMS